MSTLTNISSKLSVLNKVVLIVAPVATIVLAYGWYRQNIWRPKVKVVSADLQQGTAQIDINGKVHVLSAGQTISAGGGFGVRLGGDPCAGNCNYTRIELVKNNLVYTTY